MDNNISNATVFLLNEFKSLSIFNRLVNKLQEDNPQIDASIEYQRLSSRLEALVNKIIDFYKGTIIPSSAWTHVTVDAHAGKCIVRGIDRQLPTQEYGTSGYDIVTHHIQNAISTDINDYTETLANRYGLTTLNAKGEPLPINYMIKRTFFDLNENSELRHFIDLAHTVYKANGLKNEQAFMTEQYNKLQEDLVDNIHKAFNYSPNALDGISIKVDIDKGLVVIEGDESKIHTEDVKRQIHASIYNATASLEQSLNITPKEPSLRDRAKEGIKKMSPAMKEAILKELHKENVVADAIYILHNLSDAKPLPSNVKKQIADRVGERYVYEENSTLHDPNYNNDIWDWTQEEVKKAINRFESEPYSDDDARQQVFTHFSM